MKNKSIYIVVLVIVFGIKLYRDKISNKTNPNVIDDKEIIDTNPLNFDYLPTSTTGQIVKHQGYTLSYSEPHEQAEWVAYSLAKEDLNHMHRKRPYFYTDPKVKTKSADWRNYKKSGYDKGHLCPASDRNSNSKLYKETFLTSNISPQKHNFNAGVWNRLEQKTRYWAKKNKHLYVVTGGILTDANLETIGKEKISVPKYFYKILLDYTEPEIKAIAFLVPHEKSNKPLHNFVVSIDEIEKRTGIDFFPNLPDDIENRLESSSDYKKWSFRK